MTNEGKIKKKKTKKSKFSKKKKKCSRGPWEVPGVLWEVHGKILGFFENVQKLCFFYFFDFSIVFSLIFPIFCSSSTKKDPKSWETKTLRCKRHPRTRKKRTKNPGEKTLRRKRHPRTRKKRTKHLGEKTLRRKRHPRTQKKTK